MFSSPPRVLQEGTGANTDIPMITGSSQIGHEKGSLVIFILAQCQGLLPDEGIVVELQIGGPAAWVGLEPSSTEPHAGWRGPRS